MDDATPMPAEPASPTATSASVTEAPIEQRLKVGTELHREILVRLNDRRELSERHMESRYDDWDRTDEHCRMFIDLSRKARKADKTDDTVKKEVPFQRAIVIPVALAILLVRLTQLMSILGSREPLIQLDGRGPEDVRPAKLMQAVLGYDLEQMPSILVLYGLLQDVEKYGLGVVYDSWDQQQGWRITPAKEPLPLIAMVLKALGRYPLPPTRQWTTLRERNLWENVDPFHFWPDPRVPVSRVQEGEFIGHRTFRGGMYVKERSMKNGGMFFNTDQLKQNAGGSSSSRIAAGSSGMRSTSRNRFAKENFSLKNTIDGDDGSFYALDHMQVKLVPSDWKLGPGDLPEIWWFTWSDESVIIRAHPAEYAHGDFTYAVGESLPDPHALFNPGMIENLDGIQRVINWLLNSHVDNVRKFLNDALIFPPSLIEMADLLNPGPARHIRLTAKGEELLIEGKLNLAALIYQIPYSDVTRQHLQTINALFDMAQRLAATSDPQMSQPTDDQRTLGEVQQVIASSSQRMAIEAKWIDGQVLRPLAQRAVTNRQQFTSAEQYVRIVGDQIRELGADRLLVRPGDLGGSFDYIAHSAVLPPDPATMALTWTKILEAVLKAPQLQMPRSDGKQLDVHEIFNEAARNAGVKHIEQFYFQVTPDELLAQQLAAGNMVSTDAANADGTVPGAGIQTPVVPVGVDLRNGATP